MPSPLAVTALLSLVGLSWAHKQQCNGGFSTISASKFIANLQPGWNLGNTLDAEPTEGSWNNPPVVASVFDEVKNSGFKGVRLPGIWSVDFLAAPFTCI